MRFVQNATPGNDEQGYSQALLGVDGEWRGMEVHALEQEHAVTENDLESVAVGRESDVAESMETTDD